MYAAPASIRWEKPFNVCDCGRRICKVPREHTVGQTDRSSMGDLMSIAVILSPSRVILSEAKDLALLRVKCAKNLASVFKTMRDPSSPAAPQDDSLREFFRSI